MIQVGVVVGQVHIFQDGKTIQNGLGFGIIGDLRKLAIGIAQGRSAAAAIVVITNIETVTLQILIQIVHRTVIQNGIPIVQNIGSLGIAGDFFKETLDEIQSLSIPAVIGLTNVEAVAILKCRQVTHGPAVFDYIPVGQDLVGIGIVAHGRKLVIQIGDSVIVTVVIIFLRNIAVEIAILQIIVVVIHGLVVDDFRPSLLVTTVAAIIVQAGLTGNIVGKLGHGMTITHGHLHGVGAFPLVLAVDVELQEAIIGAINQLHGATVVVDRGGISAQAEALNFTDHLKAIDVVPGTEHIRHDRMVIVSADGLTAVDAVIAFLGKIHTQIGYLIAGLQGDNPANVAVLGQLQAQVGIGMGLLGQPGHGLVTDGASAVFLEGQLGGSAFIFGVPGIAEDLHGGHLLHLAPLLFDGHGGDIPDGALIILGFQHIDDRSILFVKLLTLAGAAAQCQDQHRHKHQGNCFFHFLHSYL